MCSVCPSVVTLPDGEERFKLGRAERVDDLNRFWLQGLDDIDRRHLFIRVSRMSLHAADFLHPCVPYVAAWCGIPPLLCRHAADELHMIYTTAVHQQVHRGVLAYGSCGVGEMGEVRDVVPHAVRQRHWLGPSDAPACGLLPRAGASYPSSALTRDASREGTSSPLGMCPQRTYT